MPSIQALQGYLFRSACLINVDFQFMSIKDKFAFLMKNLWKEVAMF